MDIYIFLFFGNERERERGGLEPEQSAKTGALAMELCPLQSYNKLSISLPEGLPYTLERFHKSDKNIYIFLFYSGIQGNKMEYIPGVYECFL